VPKNSKVKVTLCQHAPCLPSLPPLITFQFTHLWFSFRRNVFSCGVHSTSGTKGLRELYSPIRTHPTETKTFVRAQTFVSFSSLLISRDCKEGMGPWPLHFFAKQWIFFLIKYFYFDNLLSMDLTSILSM